MPRPKKTNAPAKIAEAPKVIPTPIVEPVQGSKELKTALMGIMLTRTEGTTIKEMAEQLGWKENSVRGAMSTLASKQLGTKLRSEKIDGVRRYFLVGITEESIDKACQETFN